MVIDGGMVARALRLAADLLATVRSLPRPYRLLLGLNLAWTAAAIVSGRLPTWKMFDKLVDPRYELVDAGGRSYRLDDYTPLDTLGFRMNTFVGAARFVCEHSDAKSPMKLTGARVRLRIERGEHGCRVLGARDEDR